MYKNYTFQLESTTKEINGTHSLSEIPTYSIFEYMLNLKNKMALDLLKYLERFIDQVWGILPTCIPILIVTFFSYHSFTHDFKAIETFFY